LRNRADIGRDHRLPAGEHDMLGRALFHAIDDGGGA
jgi:hypothetical protein